MGRLTARWLVVLALGAIWSIAAPVASAAGPATFGRPSADTSFGQGVTFHQPVMVDRPIGRVEILLTIADDIGPTVVEVPGGLAAGPQELSHTLVTAGPDHMIPNTPIVARWRLTAADDSTSVALGPEVRIVYADDRFAWKTASSDLVRVHWYEGSEAFGAKALRLGEDAVRDTAGLLGVSETRPVDFFVYPNESDFYDAIGPGAHENVAGSAYASIRTLLGLIPPSEIDDPLVAVRIPHEFVHLVFDTASRNPYHHPPRWLNEGLAVYLSQGYDRSDRSQVEQAAGRGTLIPLDGLAGQFPNGQDFFLAYAESASAVDYLVRTHGSDALVSLIRSYAEGRTDDEAFGAALGQDATAFGSAWFEDVGATPKPRYGPQPAPAGPVPVAWGGTEPGAVPTAPPGGAPPAGQPSAVPSIPIGGSAGGPGLPGLVVAGLAAGIVLGVVGWARRRRPERERGRP